MCLSSSPVSQGDPMTRFSRRAPRLLVLLAALTLAGCATAPGGSPLVGTWVNRMTPNETLIVRANGTAELRRPGRINPGPFHMRWTPGSGGRMRLAGFPEGEATMWISSTGGLSISHSNARTGSNGIHIYERR
jgi:hypothetical protein